ncbi:MAG: hypothetical protein IJH39_11565 [Clostridia bacterium]|nr:hypothetical protein [Clostridia bacterium]
MVLNIKFKLNSINKILKDHELQEDGKVNEFLRDTVYRLSEPYTPNDNGILYKQVVYPNNHSIKYTVPYAHYMYKGKVAVGSSRPKGIKRVISNQPLKYQGAPKRGAEWDKRMMNDRRKDVIRDIQNYIKGGGK